MKINNGNKQSLDPHETINCELQRSSSNEALPSDKPWKILFPEITSSQEILFLTKIVISVCELVHF